MQKQNKRRIGAQAEQQIRKYLSEQGYTILEMNYRCRQGEVDIIARHGKYYVFIEVKYRSSAQYGATEAAVGVGQQRRISRAALSSLYNHPLPESTPIRFDVAAIAGHEIRYIPNAFEYID